MKISKEIAKMDVKIGDAFVVGIWVMFFALSMSTILNMITYILWEGSPIMVVLSAILTGLVLYILLDIAKERRVENSVAEYYSVKPEKILDESLSLFDRMKQSVLNGETITQPFTERYEDIVLPLTKLGWSTNFLHWGFRTDDNIDITVVKRTDGFELEMKLYK